MTDAADYPTTLDATPTHRTDGGYGYEYLVDAAYFEEPTSDTVTYDPGHDVTYQFSIEGSVRIAYFEFPMSAVPRDTPKKITQELKRRTRLQYFWFFDPETNRVQVFRASRGNFQFIYNPDHHTSTTAESKRDKLRQVPDDINALFDYKDVVDRFYRELWDHRSDLASSLRTKSGHTLSKREELLSAQRIIDRLVFLYFLVERGVVVPVNDSKEMVPGKTDRVFDTLVGEHDDFWALLRTIFFDRLNSKTTDDIKFTGSYWLHVPYLNGGLFQPEDLETTAGELVSEDEELVVEDFDWEALVSELNEYNWLLDGLEGTDEDEADTVGNLTPAVLGYIYEKFVISVSKVGDDVRLSDLDASERNDLLSEGNSEVGAYYTGEDITDFKARRALWEGLLEKFDEDLGSGAVPNELNVTDLYRPGNEQSGRIESDQKDGFDVLYEEYKTSEEVLEYVDSKLTELKVCDPAVGSGSFALAVANTLFEWRSMCRPDTDEYVLRRQIIAQNIFGVDILEGATEICKLRLWLWLISATPVDTTEGAPVDERDEIPPLPDITFNIRTGNSLLGFTDTAAVTGKEQYTLDSLTMKDRLRTYGRDVGDYRESADPEKQTKRELERRHDELKSELDEWYAGAQSDSNNNRLTIADHVDDVGSAWDSLNAAPQSSTTLSVKIPDGIPDSIDEYLVQNGFTTYKYKARLDSPTLEKDDVEKIFDHLRQHFSDPEDWSVLVEREYAGQDFRDDKLDACHWPLEFPQVFVDNGGFDVVISNPPYGASLSPEEEPLLKTETNYECQGTNDSCEWFYERALDLVHDRGVISYIVSKSIAFYSSWSDIRGRLLEETEFKHIFDVGLGFVGVNLETIAMVNTLGGDGRRSTPTVHRSKDLRSTTANQPVHLGWVDQAFMMDSKTIIFRPVTDDQSDVLERLLSHGRRLGDVMSTDDTTRQLYIPDSTKKNLDDGDDHYINKNPWVQEFYLEDIWHKDLGDYRDSVDEYAVPRVMLKVLRGTRLRAWVDPEGEVVGTEKLVNVPLEESSPEEIAFVYAALNHPCASFYLQKAIFSETTETARVMDGQYSKPIPIPDVSEAVETAVAHLAWTLTMARQLDHDSNRDLTDDVDTIHSGLDAILGALYVGTSSETVDRWCDTVETTDPDTERVHELFGAFYTERFATRNGRPDQYWNEIQSLVEETVETVSQWDTDEITTSREMDVVEAVL
ncbi:MULTISPECIES: Eco57I restriction-modification methylase domain-containing protein [Haloferax]|uniref:site-specific DNA-methyltransferase (adenine-specific) n=1 Tax=Haloferax marinum TaxID=2666143 RepID=A0A6A8G7F5_9EURY|nr:MULTISPECIES: restriction endonuclease [Haloferax]KAB1197958.1 restriction endonuclease [Haloferax sp. CBA1150]MRW97024.1 restriction endonuclease [Haloferax marinum]